MGHRKRIRKDYYIIVHSEDFGSFAFTNKKDAGIVLKIECNNMPAERAKRKAIEIMLKTGGTNINIKGEEWK